MAKKGFPERFGFARNSIKEDILQFAIPGMAVFIIELLFCASDAVRNDLSGFWGTVWGLIKQPQKLSLFSVQSKIGLALIIIGLMIMIVGQVTLFRNYSGTVVRRSPTHHPRYIPFYPESNLSGRYHARHRPPDLCRKSVWFFDFVSPDPDYP